jgi:hypothetical protein
MSLSTLFGALLILLDWAPGSLRSDEFVSGGPPPDGQIHSTGVQLVHHPVVGGRTCAPSTCGTNSNTAHVGVLGSGRSLSDGRSHFSTSIVWSTLRRLSVAAHADSAIRDGNIR